jgi:hypothetical protein
VSAEEKVPWDCQRLVIGTGAYGALPVMDEIGGGTERRGVELLVLPTAEALEALQQNPENTNAILHVTC